MASLARSRSVAAALSSAAAPRLLLAPFVVVDSSMRRVAAFATAAAAAAAAASTPAGATSPSPSASAAAAGSRLPLKFVADYAYLPAPEKLNKGTGLGEDAHFITSHALGVADGVGGWADAGVDAGIFARALMSSASSFSEAAINAAAAANAPVEVDPMAALKAAHAAMHVAGSSTAVLAATRSRDGAVIVVNLGDSGATQWRHARRLSLGPPAPLAVDEAARLWERVWRSREQTQGFNFPLQLEAGTRANTPEDADTYVVPVQPGDLFILASDGMYDNLFDNDVARILAKFDYTPCQRLVRATRVRTLEALKLERSLLSPEAAAAVAADGGVSPIEDRKLLGVAPENVTASEVAALEKDCRSMLRAMATQLVVAAQKVGANGRAKSPFSVAAGKAGYNFQGGKLDDTMVVAGVVVPDEEGVPAHVAEAAARVRKAGGPA